MGGALSNTANIGNQGKDDSMTFPGDKSYKITVEHLHDIVPNSIKYEMEYDDVLDLVVRFLMDEFEKWVGYCGPIKIDNYAEKFSVDDGVSDEDVDKEYMQAIAVLIRSHAVYNKHERRWKRIRTKTNKAFKQRHPGAFSVTSPGKGEEDGKGKRCKESC